MVTRASQSQTLAPVQQQRFGDVVARETWIRSAHYGHSGKVSNNIAGKSVLSATLVQHLEETSSDVFFYFCGYSDAVTGSSGYLVRSLVAQIVQAHPDTAIYVADNYLNSYRAASRKALNTLLPELLEVVGTTHLVIDGIDEWDLREQQAILDEILPLSLSNQPAKVCKIFISSRDMPTISRIMRHKKYATTVLALEEEHAYIDQSIQAFISKKLDEPSNDLQDLDPNGSTLSEVRKLLVEKSNGECHLGSFQTAKHILR